MTLVQTPARSSRFAAPRASCLAAVLVTLLAAVVAPALAGRATRSSEVSPRAAEILAQIDRAQERIESLRADVTETRTLALLAEPQVLRGQLSFEKPEKMRWDYRSPSRRSYVLVDGTMRGWIPEQNRVEVVELSGRQRRIRRLVAIGQDSESLQREFDVTAPDGSSVAGTSELVLVPKSRRLRKRLAELRLWIDDETGLPRQLRYRTGDGDEVLLALSSVEINGALPAGTFQLDVPPGAEVVRGLSAFGLPGMVDAASDGEL